MHFFLHTIHPETLLVHLSQKKHYYQGIMEERHDMTSKMHFNKRDEDFFPCLINL